MSDMVNDVRPRRRIKALALLAMCTACTLTLGPAEVLSSAPQEARPTTRTMDGPRFGPRARADRESGGQPPQQHPPQPPPSTQERDEVLEFFRTNMKNRMSVFDQLPENRPAKTRMLQMMTERYRKLQRAKAEDPAVYELMLQQMVLQDEALSLLREQRFIAQDDTAKRAELEQLLRDKVKQLIDVTLQERRKRVEHLEQMLKDQKSRLEQDEANPDALVNQHLKQLKVDVDEMRRIWPGRRGMGMGERRPTPPATEPSAEQGK